MTRGLGEPLTLAEQRTFTVYLSPASLGALGVLYLNKMLRSLFYLVDISYLNSIVKLYSSNHFP